VLKWFSDKLRRDEGASLVGRGLLAFIVALLVAIAVLVYLGSRTRAQDHAAQSELFKVFDAERAHYAYNGTYTTSEAELLAYDSTIILSDDSDLAVSVVRFEDPFNGEDVICLERRSDSGTLFSIWVSDWKGAFYGGARLSCDTTQPTDFRAGEFEKANEWPDHPSS